MTPTSHSSSYENLLFSRGVPHKVRGGVSPKFTSAWTSEQNNDSKLDILSYSNSLFVYMANLFQKWINKKIELHGILNTPSFKIKEVF